MTKIFLTLAAAFSLAACTTTPSNQANSMEPRTPAAFGSLNQLSADLAASAKVIGNSFVTSFHYSENGLHTINQGIGDLARASSRLVVKGALASKDGAIIVFEDSKAGAIGSANDSVAAAKGSWQFIVTNSGKVIQLGKDSMDASKTAFRVTVNWSENTAEKIGLVTVLNDSRNLVIGTFKVSGEAFRITKEAIKDGANFMLDQSGNLKTDSKKFVGTVWDDSKEAVRIVMKGTGQILTWSHNEAVHIMRGSSDVMVNLGGAIWNGLIGSKNVVVEIAESSREGSVVILTAIGNEFLFFAEKIGGISEKKY